MADDSTILDVRTGDQVRRGRIGRRVGVGLLTLFVVAGAAGLFGVRTRSTSASGGGYDLTVEYPAIARAGLDTTWRVTVHHPGGFDGPITLATSADYFDIFETQGFYPGPSDETADPGRYLATYAPPTGDTFVVTFDAYVQPAAQHGRKATTSLVAGGKNVVSVDYRTRLLP